MTATEPWHRATADLVTRSHFLEPDKLPEAVDAALRDLRTTVTIYLIDAEQRHLRPLASGKGPTPEPLPVDTSLPGRAFTEVQVRTGHAPPPRLWVPLVDGTDRLGLLELVLPAEVDPEDENVRDGARLIAGLLGHLVASKTVYSDRLQQVKRSRPMAVSAELLWQLLPPLTFAAPNATVSALLEPCYEVGGDAFDYAVDDQVVSLALFDGVGHGLPAVLTTSVALAAMRAARRDGRGLADMARAVDEAIRSQWTDSRFVTAVVGRLDLRTGTLQYLNAGHPAPLLLRRGRAVRALTEGRRLPLGLPETRREVAEDRLEPGDRLLLHTDGVTEARDREGTMFGLHRLGDHAGRHVGSRLPTAETLRRISHEVIGHQDGDLRDDATLMLIEWSPEAAAASAP